MTWNETGRAAVARAAVASVLSLAIAIGAAACSSDYTVAYVYMPTTKAQPQGLINGYNVDYQTGFLTPLKDSPISSGGRNPVTLALAPNNLFFYAINHDDSDVTEFAIGTDGKVYPENTYNISGSFPTAAAIDPTGSFLYVTFTYQNNPNGTQLYTIANPGPGGIAIFPINKDNTLGTPATVNVGRNPVGVSVSANHFVYVIEQDSAATTNATTGHTGTNNLLAFSANPSSGALTPLAGVTIVAGNNPSIGFAAGSTPSGILEDPSGTHLYITDSTANQIAEYTIAASGIPTPVSSGAGGIAATEAMPLGMTFDPTSKYLYVVNYLANSIDIFGVGPTGFTLAGGQPVRLGSTATGVGPTCVTIIGSPSSASAAHATYLYVSNALSNNVTAEQILPNGTLESVQGTPFGGSTLPSCIISVPALPIR